MSQVCIENEQYLGNIERILDGGDRHVVVEMPFGSHLYGTNTKDSDMDVKGVVMPTASEVLQCHVPRTFERTTGSHCSKNTNQDMDIQYYTLPYFLKLALDGETVALDMLHASHDVCRKRSGLWKTLVDNRSMFYTSNLKAFVGYCRKQAAKYGVKGSRLEAARQALAFFMTQPQYVTIADVWDQLWENDYCFKIYGERHRMWEVCGKKMVEGSTCSYNVFMLKKFVDNYGGRARMAEKNEGIDWKAISHAFRAAYQALHIFQEGWYSYPLPETEFIKQVKSGVLSYKDEVAPKLDRLMDEVERASEASGLPKHANVKQAMQILQDANLRIICEIQ